MEFGFKEIRNGYAKAEVDAYVINMQNLIEELQLEHAGIEKRYSYINTKSAEIKKNATTRAKNILAMAEDNYNRLNTETLSAFKKFIAVKIKLNKLIQSNMHEIPDSEMKSIDQRFSEFENDIEQHVKYLKA